MPRKPREEVEDGIHHVFARGNAKGLIYRDDEDRRLYLTTLRLTVARAKWYCLAYCLMDNHVHLLIQTPKANLGAGMQRLHGLYGRLHNDRHARSGHVFQGRFGSKRVTDDEQMWITTRYIAQNPV
jgi:putative transposase